MNSEPSPASTRPNAPSGQAERAWQRWLLPLLALFTAAWFVPLLFQRQREAVVVYAAQDQVYAEPILREFTRQTGLRVRIVYDSEAVKTVGLANRLLAEQSRPQCDLYWGNEELRTRQLEARQVFRADRPWAAFGYRSRRLVINTNRLALGAAPKTISELTNQVWRGKIALAYPMFGTTATHFLALRQQWGDEPWKQWCHALRENRPLLVDGNSLVAKLVGAGEAWVGLTDSDDITAAQREGDPIIAAPLTAESLLIPNTVAVVRGGPHPASAQKLFEYLQRREVQEQLVAAGALEGIEVPAVTAPAVRPDWAMLLRDLDAAAESLKGIFLR